MTARQLSEALTLARSGAALNADIDIFYGFGLPDFKPIVCTPEALAKLVRWQCVCLDGSIDHDALNEIATIGRHRFTVVGARESERAA